MGLLPACDGDANHHRGINSFGNSVAYRVAYAVAYPVAVSYGEPYGVSDSVTHCFKNSVSDSVQHLMSDLTIIYMTANRMPKKWVDYHLGHLLTAIGDYPVITVSSKPMDLGLGETNLIQTRPYGVWSVYCEWNRAAKVADTDYVAIAEDDILYHPRHFRDFRPKLDEVAYDMSRWTLMTWHEQPTFSMIRALGGFSQIAPRKLMIEALDEREAKWPEGHHRAGEIGRRDAERRMGVTYRKHVQWWCHYPTITLAHTRALSSTFQGRPGIRRREGEVKAIEIPYWGRASDIADIFNQGVAEEATAG